MNKKDLDQLVVNYTEVEYTKDSSNKIAHFRGIIPNKEAIQVENHEGKFIWNIENIKIHRYGKDFLIQHRNLLISRLNNQYNFEFTFDKFPLNISDKEVTAYYESKDKDRSEFIVKSMELDITEKFPLEIINRTDDSHNPSQTWRVSVGKSGLERIHLTKIVADLRTRGLQVEII